MVWVGVRGKWWYGSREDGTTVGGSGMAMLQEGVIYSEADIERITGKVSVEKP